MARTKYGKYMTREIIAESKYPEITVPMARYGGCRGGGDALEAEWSCITKPMVMDQEPEVDLDRDEIIMIGSTNVEDGADFHASRNSTRTERQEAGHHRAGLIYIPKGYTHGPVTVKSLKKPIFVQSSRLSAQYSSGWDVKNESDCVSLILRNKPPRGIWAAPRCRRDATGHHRYSSPEHSFPLYPTGLWPGAWLRVVPKDLGWPAQASPSTPPRSTATTAVSSRFTPTANPIRSACTSGPIRWISKTSTPISSASWARNWKATSWTAVVLSTTCPESPTGQTKEGMSTSLSSK